MILVVGVCLSLVSLPKEPMLKNYRISRWLLSAAYVLLAMIGLMEIFGGPESGVDRVMFASTLIAASYQSLLFTFSLITLIDTRFVTRRKVWMNVTIISVAAAGLLLALFFASDRGFYTVLWTCIALYAVQLAYYVALFNTEYRKYRAALENYFSEDEEGKMAWVKRAFYLAASVGVVVVASLFLNHILYMASIAYYTLFYLYFAIKFINYSHQFDHVAPAVIRGKGEVGKDKNTVSMKWVESSIELWISEKKFLQPDITLESLAKDIGTNRSYLSRYINSILGLSFSSWITKLRIEESQKIIADNPGIPIAGIGEMVGINNRSSFYRQFAAVAGVSPGEYRKRISEVKTTVGSQSVADDRGPATLP